MFCVAVTWMKSLSISSVPLFFKSAQQADFIPCNDIILSLVPAGCHLQYLGLVLLLQYALLSALSFTYLFSVPQEFWIILVWDRTVFSTIFCKPVVLPYRWKYIKADSREAVLRTEPGLLPYNWVTAVS